MRFYCHCLNVTIDVLEKSDDQDTLTRFLSADLAQIVNESPEWFVCNVSPDQTILITWQSLLQSIPVRDMKLNRCSGCNQYTHVNNVAPNRILVNKDLLDDEIVKSVQNDPNYSEIAKILLPDSMNSPPMTRFLSLQDENIQRECESAQQLYRQSIDDAEREKEEKIRSYQREQEQIFASKTEALNKERDAFLRLMRSVPRHSVSAKTSPTLQTSSSFFNENSTESGFGSDIFDLGPTESNRHPSIIERTFSERTPDSDDEVNDDPMLDNMGWPSDNGSISSFATSVPKDIAFRPSSNFAIPQPNDGDINDLERIGKSFRELSRSIMCTDGTELFGDLPSPRLNARPT